MFSNWPISMACPLFQKPRQQLCVIGAALTAGTILYILSYSDVTFPLIVHVPSTNSTAQNESNAKEKYLIYTCVKGKSKCSGWGDRLKGISTVYLMALATGRTFGMQMDNPCQLKDYLRPNNIKWDLDPNLLQAPSEEILSLSIKSISKRMTTIDLEELLSNDITYAVANWQSGVMLLENSRYRETLKWAVHMNCYEFYHKMYTDLFSPTAEMQMKLDSFLQKGKPNNRSQLVCAQVRMGRNPTIPRDTSVRNKPSTLKAIWNFFDKFKNQQNTRFFVTSDSENVRQEAYRRFPRQITDTEGPIIHPVKSKLKGICKGFTKMILDQYVLSKCDVLVISRSGYGKMAAYLRNTQQNVYYFDAGRVIPIHLSEQTFSNFCKGNNR